MISCLVNFNPEHRRSKIPALPERARLHLHRSVPHFTPLFPLSRVSPLFPVASALFCTFLHPPKTQLFSFHTLPHSFTKTNGVRISSECFSRILTSLESASLKSQIEDQDEAPNC